MKKYSLPILVFLLSTGFLAVVQMKLDPPVLILERFMKGGGWAQIILFASFGSYAVYQMQDVTRLARWRNITWLVFAVFFFLQLALGLLGYEKFLMSGKLHLPVPGIIVGGAVYRWELSFMPILLLATVVLSGPAWCSQFCYFGVFDSLAAGNKKKKSSKIRYKWIMGHAFFLMFISITILTRLLRVPATGAAVAGGLMGFGGVVVISVFSVRKGKMVHCLTYCPIGILMNYLKFVNPFRVKIDERCTDCMACTRHCKYDALNKENIIQRKPGITCRLCGECLVACHVGSIKYQLFKLSPGTAHRVYLVVTMTIYVVFLATAKI